MKKLTLLFIFCSILTSSAQQVFVETGLIASSFDFKNSQGVTLENLQPTTKNYVGIGFRHRVLTDNLNVTVGANYNSYGATGSDDALFNRFEWDVDYVGLNAGLDYDVFNVGSLIFFVKANASIEFLVQGTQTVNTTVIDLKGAEEFDDNAIFLRGGAGFSYPISDKVAAYVQYTFGQSLPLEDTSNPASMEELKINAHNVGIGVMINLPSKNKKEEQVQEDKPTEIE